MQGKYFNVGLGEVRLVDDDLISKLQNHFRSLGTDSTSASLDTANTMYDYITERLVTRDALTGTTTHPKGQFVDYAGLFLTMFNAGWELRNFTLNQLPTFGVFETRLENLVTSTTNYLLRTGNDEGTYGKILDFVDHLNVQRHQLHNYIAQNSAGAMESIPQRLRIIVDKMVDNLVSYMSDGDVLGMASNYLQIREQTNSHKGYDNEFQGRVIERIKMRLFENLLKYSDNSYIDAVKVKINNLRNGSNGTFIDEYITLIDEMNYVTEDLRKQRKNKLLVTTGAGIVAGLTGYYTGALDKLAQLINTQVDHLSTLETIFKNLDFLK